MTLVEVSVSGFIASLVGMSLSSVYYASARVSQGSLKQVTMERDSRELFELVSAAVESASSLDVSADNAELTMTDFEGGEQRLVISEGSLVRYTNGVNAGFETILLNVAPDSRFELIPSLGSLQCVRVYIGIRDSARRDGMNFFYIDTRLSTRVPPPVL